MRQLRLIQQIFSPIYSSSQYPFPLYARPFNALDFSVLITFRFRVHGEFNTRRYTLEHDFCCFSLFLMGGKELMECIHVYAY